MYYAEIFLTVRDLMKLMDTEHYESARRRHKSIRDAIGQNKNGLTIREFCEFEDTNFDEIWSFLRESPTD